MRNSPHGRLEPEGAGFLRLWTERMIFEGRQIPAAKLAREASRDGGPVQARTPWGIVLGRHVNSAPELERLFEYLDVELVDLKRIGEGDFPHLRKVAARWGLGGG